jgi:hypothetical protein
MQTVFGAGNIFSSAKDISNQSIKQIHFCTIAKSGNCNPCGALKSKDKFVILGYSKNSRSPQRQVGHTLFHQPANQRRRHRRPVSQLRPAWDARRASDENRAAPGMAALIRLE